MLVSTWTASAIATASVKDVGQQNPVIGMVQNFNNATVGERLEEASANIAYQAGLAVNGELITDLLGPADTNSVEFIDNYINNIINDFIFFYRLAFFAPAAFSAGRACTSCPMRGGRT